MPTPLLDNRQLGSDTARANLLTNGGFEIWQRGNGPFGTTGQIWTSDRWQTFITGTDSMSVSRDTSNNDTGSQACAAVAFTLGNGAGATQIRQFIEGVEIYWVRGRTLSYSIRVKSSVANAVHLYLYSDGTGGVSGTSPNNSGGGVYQTLTATSTIPNDATMVVPIIYWTASATVYLDNAMLVIGSQPADYIPLHPADDLVRCQRYYEVVGVPGGGEFWMRVWATAAGQYHDVSYGFKATKAVSPTLTKVGTWNVANTPQPNAAAATLWGIRVEISSNAAGDMYTYNGTAGNCITAEANP